MQSIDDTPSATEQFELTTSLRRAFWLQHTGVSLAQEDLHGSLLELLQCAPRAPTAEGSSAQYMGLALKVAFEALLWSLQALGDKKQTDDDFTAAADELAQRRDAVVAVCERLLADPDVPAALQRDAFDVLADLLFVFAEEKVKGTPMQAAGFAPSSATMQQWWHCCEETLEALDVDTEGEQQASQATAEAVRVVRASLNASAVCRVSPLSDGPVSSRQGWDDSKPDFEMLCSRNGRNRRCRCHLPL
jgi:hypothetical protein